MFNFNKYLNSKQAKLLREKLKELEVKKSNIILSINNIIGKNDKQFKEYRALLTLVITGTENGEILSASDIINKMNDQGISIDNCKKLLDMTFELSKILDLIKDISIAIKLPSKQDLDLTVDNRKEQLIENAIKSEETTPTDLSKFTSLVKYELDDSMLPYAKLWFFVEALPFSLDPKDSRYISLTKSPMILTEDTRNFKETSTSNPTVNGLDIISKMETWSDTVRVSVQLKRLLSFQQYLENDVEGYKRTIEELKICSIKSDFEYIYNASKEISREDNNINRAHMLAKFYKTIEQQYGSIHGLRNDVALFISYNLDSEKMVEGLLPEIDLPVMTTIEKTFMQVEDPNFAEDVIQKKYGIRLSRVDCILKTK